MINVCLNKNNYYSYKSEYTFPANKKSFIQSGIITDRVFFKGLIPDEKLKKVKMFVFDLDNTLLEGDQETRDNIINHSKDKTLVYASARTLKKLLEVAGKGKQLPLPDYYIGDNGQNIYKKKAEKLEKIDEWTESLREKYSKEEVRKAVLSVAEKYPFPEEALRKKTSSTPKGYETFEKLKITEYPAFESDLSIYFMVASGLIDKVLPEIEDKLIEQNIKASVKHARYSKENLDKEIDKYFSPEINDSIRNLARPLRINEDGSVDTIYISAGEKGAAAEFLRKQLNIKPDQVVASGDDLNDYSLTNKGYWFVMLKNTTEHMKLLLENAKGLIQSTKTGVAGIWEAINPEN